MNAYKIWIICTMGIVSLLPAAEIPVLETPISQLLSLQGLLLNKSGQRIADGRHQACFRIFSSSDSPDLTWSECDSITVSNGVYQVRLGGTTMLPFASGKPAWLEVTVDNETMEGRIPLTGAPSAWIAAVVSDSILPSTRIGPGVAVRSINGLRDDVTFKVLGNLGLQKTGTTITLTGTDAYTAAEQIKVNQALAHSTTTHYSTDSVEVLHLVPITQKSSIINTACNENTEGSMYYHRKYFASGNGALMLCKRLAADYFLWTQID